MGWFDKFRDSLGGKETPPPSSPKPLTPPQPKYPNNKYHPAAITPVQSTTRKTFREKDGRMVPVPDSEDNTRLPSVTAQDLAARYWDKMRPAADRARAERGLDPFTEDDANRQLQKIARRMETAMRDGELLPSQFREIWSEDAASLQASASRQAIELRNASVAGRDAPMYLFYGRG